MCLVTMGLVRLRMASVAVLGEIVDYSISEIKRPSDHEVQICDDEQVLAEIYPYYS
jgi:hypothetical protein